MRVRIALGLAFLATAIGFAIDMSGSAQRVAGDDKVAWPAPAFTDIVPGRGRICVGDTVLPNDAASFVMTIGSYRYKMPRIAVAFHNGAGRVVSTGLLKAGAPQGVVSLPLSHPHGGSIVGTLCLHVEGPHQVAVGGADFAVAAAFTKIDGQPQFGRPSVIFYRPGRDSWWSLLGTLDLRFGLGKSPIFGDWTLPLIALVALALWFAVARLLWRELR
ncbi:MAG TPA: hypothetical protein VGG41_02935 [Solirubrobacteraceae bacterium]